LLFARIAFNFGQIGTDFIQSYFFGGSFIVKDLLHFRIIKLVENYIKSTIYLYQYVAEDVINIVKAPFYAIAIQMACFIVLVSPNDARKVIGNIERHWNMGVDWKQDFRYHKDFKDERYVKVAYKVIVDRRQDVAFYMAACFQPRGSLLDNKISNVNRVDNNFFETTKKSSL
jgi:hypothetical protein